MSRVSLRLVGFLLIAMSCAAMAQTSQNITALKAKAESGNAEAQYTLGESYYWGKGVHLNYAQAAIWWRKAAEQGDAQAQVKLGDLYSLGQGVPQDYAQATIWYRKAAEQSYAAAQFSMGAAYDYGQGVPQDHAQAALWYRRAAEQGHESAQINLGYLYEYGMGVPQDYVQSVFWFRKAAEHHGSMNAEYFLKEVYQKAAEQGIAEAQYNLGEMYFLGEGIHMFSFGKDVRQNDLAQSVFWFRKAAEQGNSEAQSFLGHLYTKGIGVPQDYAEAYFWYDIAAAGKPDAKDAEINVKARDDAAFNLTSADLSRIQERARKWFENHAAKTPVQ